MNHDSVLAIHNDKHKSKFSSLQIRKYQEDLKTSQNCSLVPSLAPKINIFSILAKESGKIEIELFPQGAISQKNYSLCEIFWPRLQQKLKLRNSISNLAGEVPIQYKHNLQLLKSIWKRTNEKIFWSHKIPTEKSLRPMKQQREEVVDPRNIHEGTIPRGYQTYETHDGTSHTIFSGLGFSS